MSKSSPVYGSYKDHLIIEERYHWGYEVVAIPDSGDTIRKKFIGYTKPERAAIIRQAIDESLSVTN